MVGYGATPSDRWIHQFLILSLTHDGPTAVVIFFTVAGYVCSYKPLQAITAHDHALLGKSLPPSVFRRWFRVYLPMHCSTLAISALVYIGAYEPSRSLLWTGHYRPKDPTHFAGPGNEWHVLRRRTCAAQLGDWWFETRGLMNFWREHILMPPIDWQPLDHSLRVPRLDAPLHCPCCAGRL